MVPSPGQINRFYEALWTYYAQYGRNDLPWRRAEADGHFDPYKILVSELMLQQTQVSRVIPKFQAFIQTFPSVEALASADLGTVLRLWQGLGYNRRAKYLWQAARMVSEQGHFPEVLVDLMRLPGVGKNTAGAIVAYAYNQPSVFVETNVRTVIIHHFFATTEQIPDSVVISCIAAVLDRQRPRQFYWAVMDYGAHIKTTHGNLSRRSSQYSKQTAFVGSNRQIRGSVIRLLADCPRSAIDLAAGIADDRLDAILAELLAEGLIRQKNGLYRL